MLPRGRYLGRSGTGPVLYKGACPSAHPPLSWATCAPAPCPYLPASLPPLVLRADLVNLPPLEHKAIAGVMDGSDAPGV